jgi:hypothetical protein
MTFSTDVDGFAGRTARSRAGELYKDGARMRLLSRDRTPVNAMIEELGARTRHPDVPTVKPPSRR